MILPTVKCQEKNLSNTEIFHRDHSDAITFLSQVSSILHKYHNQQKKPSICLGICFDPVKNGLKSRLTRLNRVCLSSSSTRHLPPEGVLPGVWPHQEEPPGGEEGLFHPGQRWQRFHRGGRAQVSIFTLLLSFQSVCEGDASPSLVHPTCQGWVGIYKTKPTFRYESNSSDSYPLL